MKEPSALHDESLKPISYYLVDVTQLYPMVKGKEADVARVVATLLFETQEVCERYIIPGSLSGLRVTETLFKFERFDVAKVSRMADEFCLEQSGRCFSREFLLRSYFKHVKVGDYNKVYLVFPKLEIKNKKGGRPR